VQRRSPALVSQAYCDFFSAGLGTKLKQAFHAALGTAREQRGGMATVTVAHFARRDVHLTKRTCLNLSWELIHARTKPPVFQLHSKSCSHSTLHASNAPYHKEGTKDIWTSWDKVFDASFM
jgi:hypothetical protein